ncbi:MULTISPECIES: hypothetical protein [Acidobacteriaceae]|nr:MULTISPECIES: hypothetical protein [Acidobacteriaceae]MDW5264954.1 hypothetical protein [Edaphobacter sp.]
MVEVVLLSAKKCAPHLDQPTRHNRTSSRIISLTATARHLDRSAA